MPIDDAAIERAGDEAKRMAKRQSDSRAGKRPFSFFGQAIRGTAAGVHAAQGAIQRGDPISAALLAAGGAMAAPSEEQIEAQQAAEMAKARLQELEARPIQSVSPGMVQELAALGFDANDLPIGAIKQLAPLIEAGTTKRRQDIDDFRAFQEQKNKQKQAGLVTEEGFRKEFTGLSKDFRTIRDSYSRLLASAKNPSQAGDLALIFNYMKILDPGSTVREGEFATAENAGNISQRVFSQYNKLLTEEGRLADNIRDDFVDRAGELYNSQRAIQGKLEQQFNRLAESAGVSSQNVTIDQGFDAAPAISLDAIKKERERRNRARSK